MGDVWSKKNWLSFEEARALVQDESIGSEGQYKKWWDYNRPAQIPKYPYNVWKTKWKGWNDYLGNANVFDGTKKVYRPYGEAVQFVHSLKLRTQRMWFDYIRENGLPSDIPSRPEMVYPTWVSWYHWLGNTAAARVAVQQEVAENAGILYVVHLHGRPANVYRIGIASELKSLSGLGCGYDMVKAFKMEEGYDWEAVVSLYANKWWEDEKEWVCGNIHELLFDIDLAFV